jgi:hypothetical protein
MKLWVVLANDPRTLRQRGAEIAPVSRPRRTERWTVEYDPHPTAVVCPNRRPAVTRDLPIGNMPLTAAIGFDETGQPAEIFLASAKDGCGMAAILRRCERRDIGCVATRHSSRSTRQVDQPSTGWHGTHRGPPR